MNQLWLFVVLLSLAQFARNPRELRNFLSVMRKGLGPTSFLFTVFIAGMEMKYGKVKQYRLVKSLKKIYSFLEKNFKGSHPLDPECDGDGGHSLSSGCFQA